MWFQKRTNQEAYIVQAVEAVKAVKAVEAFKAVQAFKAFDGFTRPSDNICCIIKKDMTIHKIDSYRYVFPCASCCGYYVQICDCKKKYFASNIDKNYFDIIV